MNGRDHNTNSTGHRQRCSTICPTPFCRGIIIITCLGGDDLELYAREGQAVEDGRHVVQGRGGREDPPGGQPTPFLNARIGLDGLDGGSE